MLVFFNFVKMSELNYMYCLNNLDFLHFKMPGNIGRVFINTLGSHLDIII